LTQRSLSLTFNEFQPSDYGKLAQIYDSIFPERARSIDEWKFFDESLDQSKYYWKRYTIRESEKGEIVAFGELGHAPWMFNPDKYWTEIWVDPSKHGRGIGSAIYRKIEEDLRKLGAIAAWASTREDFVTPIKFLVNRGFAEKMRGWESTINPSEGDFSVFEKYRVQAVNNGITFATLAKELQNDPETYRKLYELVQTVFRDVPMQGKTDTMTSEHSMRQPTRGS
jgi:GNAT superfamily N-acetyltransferase